MKSSNKIRLTTATLLSAILIQNPAYAGITIDPTNNDVTNSSGSTITNPATGAIHIGHTAIGQVDINSGSVLKNTGQVHLGYGQFANGIVNLKDTNSQWIISNNASGTNLDPIIYYNLYVGQKGNATLNITNGANLKNALAYIGNDTNTLGPIDPQEPDGPQIQKSIATVNVSGPGSTWTNFANLTVGNLGDANLNISNAALVTNSNGIVASLAGSVSKVTVQGATTLWNNIQDLTLGKAGNASLTIQNGALVQANNTFISKEASSTSTATLTGPNSSLQTQSTMHAGYKGQTTININNGASITSQNTTFSYSTTANTTATITDPNSIWVATEDFTIARTGKATLNIENGAQINNKNGYLAKLIGSNATTKITGQNTNWINSQDLFIGNAGIAKLDIQDKANISSVNTFIAYNSSAQATTTVNGQGTNWQTDEDLTIARAGQGTLNIKDAATVNNKNAYIAKNTGSIGSVTLTGINTKWTTTENLYVGGTSIAAGGAAELTINTDTSVVVENKMKIWGNNPVNIFGGTLKTKELELENNVLNFIVGKLHLTQSTFISPLQAAKLNVGTITIGKTLRIDGTATLGTVLTIGGGTLSTDSLSGFEFLDFFSGTLKLTTDDLNIGIGTNVGHTLEATTGRHFDITNNINVQQNALLLIGGGTLSANTLNNNAVIQGFGQINATLNNATNGQIRTTTNQHLRFNNTNNTNAGFIEAINSQIEFSKGLTNQASTGFISGRNATFRFQNLINHGSIGLSFGTSDIHGNIDNKNTGLITITGNSNATFYDDIINNGNIQISSGSSAVFFGSLSGANGTTGSGHVFLEGDLRPGNSPGNISFGGNLTLGTAAKFIIELAGTTQSQQYDHININGDLELIGNLQVSAINDFQLQHNQIFNIIDILGTDTNARKGKFKNLNQHDIVDTINDIDIYIDYFAGDGNDIALFTLHTGDANKDRVVNDEDLDLIKQNLGTNSNLGDTNHDGKTNLSDLFATRNNFTPTTTSIPEPTTLFTILALAPTALTRKKHKHYPNNKSQRKK